MDTIQCEYCSAVAEITDVEPVYFWVRCRNLACGVEYSVAKTACSLGEIIRDARENKGITMTELAKQVQITQGYLSKIENNLKVPVDGVLQRIGNVLGIDNFEGRKMAQRILELEAHVRELEQELALYRSSF